MAHLIPNISTPLGIFLIVWTPKPPKPPEPGAGDLLKKRHASVLDPDFWIAERLW